jgi:undecaprenyl-diphosphatase
MTDNAVTAPAWGPIWTATGLSFVVALAVIAWFMRYISSHTFTPFMIYRIVLALVLFALLGFGVLEP